MGPIGLVARRRSRYLPICLLPADEWPPDAHHGLAHVVSPNTSARANCDDVACVPTCQALN